jgi:hypothetical protein
MRWQTEVEISPLKNRIQYKDKILFVGSCFANEIGSIMKSLRFNVLVNPFGVLFNPWSVTDSLLRVESAYPFTEDDVIQTGDLYKSFSLGSGFAALSRVEFLAKSNAILAEASAHFKECRWVLVTLGTSRVYREKNRGVIVSNCHKLPDSQFERFSMGPEEIADIMSPVIERNPQKNWIFTVSPVRHLRDGANGNQLSKARLLLAVEILQKRFNNLNYFPSYEIFIDQLRDYRFYATDMVHPSADSLSFVWELFMKYAVDSSCNERIKQISSLNALKSHRPLFPESNDYKNLLEKIAILERNIANDKI